MGERMLVVVGAGPGVGGAVARRWGREGYDAGLVSLDPQQLEALGQALQGEGLQASWRSCDITDHAAGTDALRELAEQAGRVDVLHFNPSAFRQKDPLELTPAELLRDVGLGVGALLTAVQAVLPYMPEGGRITVTGSMAADRPWNQAASLGVQKAGVRNLVHSIDTTLASRGIRAVSVTVRGSLAYDDPSSPFHPDRVAEALFQAARQPERDWRTEVHYPG